MKRKALIIGSPDDVIIGVHQDVINYRNFLLSPIGGYWRSDELIILENPNELAVISAMTNLKNADYSMAIFAGHGCQLNAHSPPTISIQPGVDISSGRLKSGAPKHTLILDCCRVHPKINLHLESMTKSASFAEQMNGSKCRTYYDLHISNCHEGTVVLYGCSDGELSGESSTEGGYYSSSLIQTAKSWGYGSQCGTSRNYDILSVVQAHHAASSMVRSRTSNEQNPTADYSRTAPHFPFAVVA